MRMRLFDAFIHILSREYNMGGTQCVHDAVVGTDSIPLPPPHKGNDK